MLYIVLVPVRFHRLPPSSLCATSTSSIDDTFGAECADRREWILGHRSISDDADEVPPLLHHGMILTALFSWP